MPRSLATIGAETTLTSCSIGRSRPAMRRRGQRLGVHLRDRALVGELHLADARSR